MTDTLSSDQVNAAMTMLVSTWANQSLPDSVRDTWRRKLATLRRGEFQPAFDAWLDGPRARFRPEPGELMDIVLARRPRAVPPNDWSQPHPDGPAPEPDQDLNHRELDRIRAECNIPTKYRKEASK